MRRVLTTLVAGASGGILAAFTTNAWLAVLIITGTVVIATGAVNLVLQLRSFAALTEIAESQKKQNEGLTQLGDRLSTVKAPPKPRSRPKA